MTFGSHLARLDTFLEEDEEGVGVVDSSYDEALPTDVPQCFSHFTYSFTEGRDLVCDLQGVWNETDGFIFTDPVIQHSSHKSGRLHGRNGHVISCTEPDMLKLCLLCPSTVCSDIACCTCFTTL